MPTFSSFGAFARELDQLEHELRREEGLRITRKQAEAARKIATAAARRDLGGNSRFSGWAGRDLADLRVKQLRGNKVGHILAPTRKSGGPWKVAEQGRNKGTATGRGGKAIFFGPGINRETGETARTKSGAVRKVRRFKAKRWNGYTAGKGTASDAISAMERVLPKVAEDGVTKVTRKHFDVT